MKSTSLWYGKSSEVAMVGGCTEDESELETSGIKGGDY